MRRRGNRVRRRGSVLWDHPKEEMVRGVWGSGVWGGGGVGGGGWGAGGGGVRGDREYRKATLQ